MYREINASSKSLGKTRSDTLTVFYDLPQANSKIIIGNMEIYNTKKFNWLNRKMIKLIFGFKVEPIKEGKTNE